MTRPPVVNYSQLRLAILFSRVDDRVFPIAYRVLDHVFPPGVAETWSPRELAFHGWARSEVHDLEDNAELDLDELPVGIYRLVVELHDGEDDVRYTLVARQLMVGFPWPGWADDGMALIDRYRAAEQQTYTQGEHRRWDELTCPAHNRAYEQGLFHSNDPHQGPLPRATQEAIDQDQAQHDAARAELKAIAALPGYVAAVYPDPGPAYYGPVACARCGRESAYHVSSSVSGGPQRHRIVSLYACAAHLGAVIPQDLKAPVRVESIVWDHSSEPDGTPARSAPALAVGQVWTGDGERYTVRALRDEWVVRVNEFGVETTIERPEWWRWTRAAGAQLEAES